MSSPPTTPPLLSFSSFNFTSTSPSVFLKDFVAQPETPQHMQKQIKTGLNLQKFDHDQHSGIVAFLPLLSLMRPSFTKEIIQNTAFISSLSERELQLVQSIIDEIIYEKSQSKPFDGKDELFKLKLIAPYEHEFPSSYFNIFVEPLKYSPPRHSMMDYLDLVDGYLQEQPSKCMTQVRDFLLDDICDALKVEEMREQIQSHPQYQRLGYLILTRYTAHFHLKTKKDLTFSFNNETINNTNKKNNISKLLNDQQSSDLELVIGGEKVYCHRTILKSFSQYFQIHLNGVWNDSDLVFDKEWKYYIQFIYQNSVDIPNDELIPALDIALMNFDEEYCGFICAKLRTLICEKNFFEMVNLLATYLDTTDEKVRGMVSNLKDKIVETAMQSVKFDEENVTLLPFSLMVDILEKKDGPGTQDFNFKDSFPTERDFNFGNFRKERIKITNRHSKR